MSATRPTNAAPSSLIPALGDSPRPGSPRQVRLLLVEDDQRLGRLELDPSAHTVRAGSAPIELSQKQFALLEFLLRHRGQVVTRMTLLSRVFSYDFDPGTNLVDVHVAQLRRKLEPCGAASFIQTIRGVGYRAGDPSDE